MTRSYGRGPGPAAVVLFGALQFYLAAPSSSAVAAVGVVLLLQPTPTSSGVRRCLTRIRNELKAGGLDVTILDRGSSNDPFSVAEALNRESDAIATITLLGDPDKGPAELWIVDRIAGRGTVRRIIAPTDEPARVPEILAVRALELLRASALELLVVNNRAAAEASQASNGSTTTPIVARPAPAPPPDSGEGVRLALETGLSLFQSVGGPGPAVVPLVRFRIRSARAPFLRLTLAGLGTQPRVDAAQGSARVGYDMALIEGGAAFRRDKRLRPVVTLGVGTLRVTVDGNGSWPYEGRLGGRWAALVGGAAGIMTSIAGQFSLALELHVLWAAPYPVIRFAGADAATIGRPALWATLTLVAWL